MYEYLTLLEILDIVEINVFFVLLFYFSFWLVPVRASIL